MRYQSTPKWDQDRPIILKIGFVMSLAFALMAFNYTTYPVEETYEISDDGGVLEILEVIPPRTPPEKKILPPPPAPKITEVLDVKPEEELEFVEEKPVFEPTESAEATEEVEEPTVQSDEVPPIVTPMTPEEPEPDEGPVLLADRMPIYGDCDVDADERERRACTSRLLMSHIYQSVKYPPTAREIGIEGTVVVSFVVSKSGRVENIEIIKGLAGGCSEEVVKAIKTLSDFLPGKHKGRPVAVIYRLPVKFALE